MGQIPLEAAGVVTGDGRAGPRLPIAEIDFKSGSSRRRRPVRSAAMTGIDDVARAAGVSPATVSRVLNGTSPVSTDRAERVRRAAATLGYQPFGPARALRRQRTSLWAAIVADVENPFFTAMIRGVEDVALGAEHRLVLCNSDEDLDKEAAYIDVAIADRMAGVIIAVASTARSRLDPLLDAGIPVVAVDRRPRRAGVDSVVVDNRLGAEQATTHLLDGGARRVACITGPARISTAESRLAGYREAFAARGRRAPPGLVRRADFREGGGYRATLALLDEADPPDALFVANNQMTLGALRALKERRRRVPDDVAIVGFDEAPWAALVEPALTVVAQPTHELGRQAAQLLASAAPGLPTRHLVLTPTLVVRASSRRR
jgi:LacI family transcriptional regulator